MKPRLLDLFCGAGGAAAGYDRAGFDVLGVDIKPQPNYPFEFVQIDAVELLRLLVDGGTFGLKLPGVFGALYALADFAAIHASPPCQLDCAYRRRGGGVGDGYPDLIGQVREVLQATGLPYVIENVPGARSKLRDPIQLCGSSFGLDVRRHRLFETNWPLMVPPCNHSWQTPRFPAATNRAKNSRRTVEIGVYRIPLDVQKRAMGVDWDVTLNELSNAVPPAYTEHIGHRLIAQIDHAVAA